MVSGKILSPRDTIKILQDHVTFKNYVTLED